MKHLSSIILVIALFFSFTFTSCQKEEINKANTSTVKEIKSTTGIEIMPIDNLDFTDTAVIDLLTNFPTGKCLYLITDEKGNSFFIWGNEEDVMNYIEQNPSIVVAHRFIKCKDEHSAIRLAAAFELNGYKARARCYGVPPTYYVEVDI